MILILILIELWGKLFSCMYWLPRPGFRARVDLARGVPCESGWDPVCRMRVNCCERMGASFTVRISHGFTGPFARDGQGLLETVQWIPLKYIPVSLGSQMESARAPGFYVFLHRY